MFILVHKQAENVVEIETGDMMEVKQPQQAHSDSCIRCPGQCRHYDIESSIALSINQT